MKCKMPSFYYEKYSGYFYSLLAGYLAFRYIKPSLILGRSEIFDKSIDVGGISFGFLLTVLTLLIQTENSVIKNLKKGNRFSELISFNKEVVICSILLFSFSLFLLIYGGEALKLNCIFSKLCVSIYFSIVTLTANKVFIFLRVFYSIIT
jgi:hypothetical protein